MMENRDSKLLNWISAQLHPDGMPPSSKATTDYLAAGGENPRLHAFVISRLHPAGEPAAQAAAPVTDAELDEVVLTDAERESWVLLNDAQRFGALRGNKACLEQWAAAAAALEAEATGEPL